MISAQKQEFYWQLTGEEALRSLGSSAGGISESEASRRLQLYGANSLQTKRINTLSLLIRQLTGNPLVIILSVATVMSYLLGEKTSSLYIFGMILLSVVLGFWNEWSAEKTITYLLKRIAHTTIVIRNKEKKEVAVSGLTIGDVVILSRGDIIPADLRLIEARNLEINESVLTGESIAVVKTIEPNDVKRLVVSEMKNIGFMGTTIEIGSAVGVVFAIGKSSEYGKIAESVTYIKPTTEFQKGLGSFGNLIIRTILILTITIFGVNAAIGHPFIESLLFALAIAVGLTPELLPVIVTVSLSHGAGNLAKKHVLTKRLLAIENLGNMDILCTDKTGTLTEGKIQLVDAIRPGGIRDTVLLTFGLLCNSAEIHHKVVGNGIDAAIWEYALDQHHDIPEKYAKVYEEPFDYDRQVMYSVIDRPNHERMLLAKGAPEAIFAQCIAHNVDVGKLQYKKLSDEGYRVVAIASRPISKKDEYGWNDAKHLELRGFLTFLDTPKKTAKAAIDELEALSVEVKILTGDSEIITRKICQDVDIPIRGIALGKDIETMSDETLSHVVGATNVFVRVSPNQKLRIIRALQREGHTVGYLGDGINDVPALHHADVGITVDTAVDVAKEAASVILLRKSLNVIDAGIIEGRQTFQNTIKYILMVTSSNFGNMFSAAIASFFFPFLPMTPVQILLSNGLYDLSQVAIPTDNVDSEALLKPRHWNIDFIKRYMFFFGPLSSIFDLATFGVLAWGFGAKGQLFQTGWFLESISTQILVVFIIRTARRPFFFSKPSIWLLFSSLAMVGVAFVLPLTAFGSHLGLVVLEPKLLATIFVLVVGYLFLVELMKTKFLREGK